MTRIVATALVALFAWPALGKSPKALGIRRAGEGGIVGLADGTIVAWNIHGDVQLRSPAGVWRPVDHLPASFIAGAAAAGDVALLLADVVGPHSSAVASHVFAVRSDGTVKDLAGPPDVTSIAASPAGQAWLAASDGVFQLLAGGTLGPRVGVGATGTILVARPGGPPIICADADLSKAHHQPATCRSGSPAWSASGTWTAAPFPCGGALIEKGGDQVVSRSLASGQVLDQASIPPAASVACSDALVLVGTDRVQALEPRTLHRQWSTSRLARSITAACLQGDELVYFTPAGPGATPRPDRDNPRR